MFNLRKTEKKVTFVTLLAESIDYWASPNSDSQLPKSTLTLGSGIDSYLTRSVVAYLNSVPGGGGLQ